MAGEELEDDPLQQVMATTLEEELSPPGYYLLHSDR
jgi:hypothetical protein